MKEEEGISMEQWMSQQFGPSRLTDAWPTALEISTAPKAAETALAPTSSALHQQGQPGLDWRGQTDNGSDGGQFGRAATEGTAAPLSATDSRKSGVLLEDSAVINFVDHANGGPDFASASGMMEVDETAPASQNLATADINQDFTSEWASTHRDQQVHLNLNLPPDEEAEAASHISPEGVETTLNFALEDDVETVVYEGWGYPLEDAWMYARRTTRSRAAVEQDSWKFSQESMSGVSTKQDGSKSSLQSMAGVIVEPQVMASFGPFQAASPLVSSSPSSHPIPSMSGGICPAEDNARPQADDLNLPTSYTQRDAEHAGVSTLVSHLRDEQPGLSPECTGLQDERTQTCIQSGRNDSFATNSAMIFESKLGSENVYGSNNAGAKNQNFAKPHSKMPISTLELHGKKPVSTSVLCSKKTISSLEQHSAKSSSNSEQQLKMKPIVPLHLTDTSGTTHGTTHVGTRDQAESHSLPKCWANDNEESVQPLHGVHMIPKDGANDNFDFQPLRQVVNDAEEVGQPSQLIEKPWESLVEASHLSSHGVEDGKVPVALWAKCGEKWEPGIRCCSEDCPTVTLKSKPHYSKRNYLLIFFPAGGHWSWVDVTHTCPISHHPLPLNGNGTYESERETVKDLNLPRRKMLLRLGAEMLDISDRLHIKAVTESSRDVNVWKKFAEDAAHASNYSQLGSLLVRLHLAIGQPYVKLAWMTRRYQNWKIECIKASTARAVDKLTKELINAVHWEVVSPFWNEPEQPELDPAWSNWKGDAFDEVFEEKNEMAVNEDESDEDEGSRSATPLASDNETLERGSVGGGAKRFKQQARAKRSAGALCPNLGQASQPNECRVLALSSETPREELEGSGLPLCSSTIHIAPLCQDKDSRLVLDSVARDSGLCTAFLKGKGRRCIRRANPGIRYCGKHKRLTGPADGVRDLSVGLGQAWESGLCSAYVELDSTRCQGCTVGNSLFCEFHFNLSGGQNLNDEDENVLLSSVRDRRCKGITNKGCQCTHKPKGDSPFCEKHILQESNGGRERHEPVAVGESSSHKRQKLVQDKSWIEVPDISRLSTLAYAHSGRGGAICAQSSGTGLVNRNLRTPGSGVGTNTMSRKRKFAAPVIRPEVSCAQDLVCRGSPGNKEDLRTRCMGRIAKDESQCSFKARAGNHYLCTKHLVTAENHMSARGLQPGPNAERAAVALMERYMKAALDVPAGEEGVEKRNELVRWAKCQASQDVYCAEKFLTITTEEVARLQKMLREVQKRDSELDSQDLVQSEDRSMVEFHPRDLSPPGDNRGVDPGSTLIWPSLVEGRLVHLGTTGLDRSEDTVAVESGTQVTNHSDAEPLHLLEYVKEAERSAPARCGLCDLIFVARGNLCTHWKDCHKKEASRLVKGYTCRSCRSFLYSRKHLVQKHWKKRHSSEAQVPKSEQWSAVCAACDSAFELYEDVLEHVCLEHPDMLMGEALKEASVLGRVDIPVEIAMGEDLECKECDTKFDSHWDYFHHFSNTHKTAGVQVESTSDLNTMEPTLAEKSAPAGQTFSVTDKFEAQSESKSIQCHLCGEKISFAHVLCKAAGTSPDMEPVDGSLLHLARGIGRLPLRSESREKISLTKEPVGDPPNKRKLAKQSEEEEKAVSKEDIGKTVDGDKGTLLLKMKTAVHTAQVRNIKLSKRGEASALRPRKALYSLTKGGQIFQDYDATIIADDNDLLDIAQSACCQKKLLAILGQKYGSVPPEKLFKRTIEVCNASNVKLECFSGNCRCCVSDKAVDFGNPGVRNGLFSLGGDVSGLSFKGADHIDKHDTVIEQRGKLDGSESSTSTSQSGHNNPAVLSKFDAVVVTTDLSRGQEPAPVACLVDKDVLAYLEKMKLPVSSPEDSFTYITQRVLDPSLGLDPENYKVGCSCHGSQCAPKSCDHVHIFDNDNVDALDIYGREMKGRFPYDGNGCIILEEGYLVYECNSSCNCNRSCANRVLQKGVNVRLEVFKTFQKGWAVRAAQNISRGTFVCEYLGEVLRDQDANKRGETYDKVGCSYLYDIDAHLDVTGRVGRAKPFVIDATKHGNVARFINHSCAPNLINYQVLVDSMDYQLAHIGLFASRDIKIGEELAYDYRYRLLPGKGCPCHCGAPNCRGRLY